MPATITAFWNRALLLGKTETAAYGQEANPDTANDVMLAHDISFTPVRETSLRPDSAATLGQLGVVVEKTYCNFSFKIISFGGKVGAGFDPIETPLLQMCGTSYAAAANPTGAIFGPVSLIGNVNFSDTLWFYMDGMVRKILGARSNCIIRSIAGKYVELEFNGIGKYAQIEGLAFPTSITRPQVTTPLYAKSMIFTIVSAVPNTESVEFDFGNELTLSPCVNEPTGIGEVNIVKRDPRLITNPEADTNQAPAWEGYVDSQTSLDIDMSWAGATGYGAQLSIPAGKMFSCEGAEKGGKLIYNMNIVATESSLFDDDWVLTYAPV